LTEENKEINVLVVLDDGTRTNLRVQTKLPEYQIQAGSATLRYILKRLFPELRVAEVLAVTGPHGIDTELYEVLCNASLQLDQKLDTVANLQVRETLGVVKLNLDLILKLLTD
jgi:hypothetical protein